MKKELTLIFFVCILFGIMLNSFVIADTDKNMGDNTAVISAGANGQIVAQTIKQSERIREEIRTFTNAQGLQQKVFVRVEREIETKNGKVYLKIKTNFFYSNGTQTQEQIKIIKWLEKGVVKRQFKLEGETDDEDIEVDVDDEIEIEDVVVEGKTKFRAKLSNGNISYIEVMPDWVREMIRQRLRIRNQTNMTIKLKEKVHKNIPRVVYNAEFNEHGKFLGVFKLAMRVNAEVDPETGELLGISRPWWAFLIVIPETEDNETEDNGTEDNETEDNETEAPQWFDNSTNSTINGAYIKHSVRWTDDVNLSGYIFSFDNGVGTFTNDTFVEMDGTSNWSNVTKVVNSTVNSIIRWRVYAEDTSNNLGATDIFNYNTTA